MNKVLKLVALSSMVATTAVAEHSRARVQVQTNLFDAATRKVLSFGLQNHVYKNLSTDVDFLFSLQAMMKESKDTTLNFFHGANVNFLWYNNACAKDGFFGRLGFSYTMTKESETTDTNQHDLSLTFGGGYRYELGCGWAISNSLFVEKRINTSDSSITDTMENITADTAAKIGNMLTDNLRYEIFKISYSVY